MAYKVKIDVFEGPFDLLVFLIENAEMNIYDIRVSEITSQYLEYLELMQRHSVEVTGEFMVLAATLIELKSKMLLPRPKAEGDLSPLEDPRSVLVQKLLEYKKFRAAAEGLEEREELARQVHTKPQEDLARFTMEPDEFIDLDLNQFVRAFNLFIQKKKKLEDIRKSYSRIERERLSVEQRIGQIGALFDRKEKIRFTDLVEEDADRYAIVLTFVAVLEMIRQKAVHVKQHANFGEIYLTRNVKKQRQEVDPGDDKQKDDEIRI